MQMLLNLTTLIIPPLAMLGGLSLGVTVPIFCIIYMMQTYKNTALPNLNNQHMGLLFLLWCLISCAWSNGPLTSLSYYLPAASMVVLGMILKAQYLDIKRQIFAGIYPYLLIGVMLAMMLFTFEYISGGMIGSSFRAIVKSNNAVFLYMLDRGCSFLSVVLWVPIAYFFAKRHIVIGAGLYATALYLLLVSDSLAGFVAFICGGLVFFGANLFGKYYLKLASIGLIVGSLLMPICFYTFPAQELVEKFSFLPLSAKHRIFIWGFTAQKIVAAPIIGNGFATSKFIKPTEDQFLNYDDVDLPLFSSHPHNNVLQLFLETGAIGVILFLIVVWQNMGAITRKFETSHHPAIYSAMFACLVDYYAIGMISFNIWQLWWVCAGVITTLFFAFLAKDTERQQHKMF